VKILDLFCCAGGAAMGYHRSGFEVTGVDIKPQKHYPFQFVQGDVFELMSTPDFYKRFDVIHASPPCQAYSLLTGDYHRGNHPKLIPDVQKILKKTGKPYIIENVSGARRELIRPIKLCGSMFGLKIFRHRWFEIFPEFLIMTPPCNHNFIPVLISGTPNRKGHKRKEQPLKIKRKAIGIDWMITKELDEAIPPAYTEFLGKQLISFLGLK